MTKALALFGALIGALWSFYRGGLAVVPIGGFLGFFLGSTLGSAADHGVKRVGPNQALNTIIGTSCGLSLGLLFGAAYSFYQPGAIFYAISSMVGSTASIICCTLIGMVLGIILGIIADEAIYNLPNVFSGVYLGATVAAILGAIQYIFLDSLRGLLIGVPIGAMIGGVLCIIAKRTSKPTEPATAEWDHSVEGLTRGGALIAAIAAVFATVVGACIGAPLVGSFIYAYWGALLSDVYLLPATTFSTMLGALRGALVATLICRTAVMRAWMSWHKADLGGILPGQYYENSRSAYNGATIGALIGIFIGATIGSAFGGFVFAVFGGSLGWMEGEWLGAAIGEARRSTSESLVVYPKGGRHFVAGAYVGLLVGAYFLAVFSGAAEPRTTLDVQVFSVTYSAPIGVCAVFSSWLIVGRLMGERIGSIIDLRLI